ncbi:MAG: site-specific integrase [Ruminococcus sp.]|nr:site-specific integrase [Ruminococcus sp.]
MASVEKRGNSYRIKVSCGYKTDGKQVTQKMTRTPDPNMTEKQIEKELQRQIVLFEEECRHGQVVSAVKFEAFTEEWFEEYAKLNLKSTTYTRQRQLTKRVYAAIGHIRLDRLTTREIQKFINSLTQDGVNENTGKPLSRKTMIHYLSFISTVIDYAIKMNMISDNPCRRVTIPKGSKKERKILTIEETEEFFKLLKTAPLKYQAFFTLDIYSGMRRGEMLGLEWKDIDFQTGVIHIQRTSNYTKAKGIYTDTTKTENSVRFVKVPMEIVEVLLLYKKEQDEERIKLDSKWHETDRLFVKYDGQHMNPQTPYGWLKEFCEKNNFPFYGIHQFRHLHTNLLIGAGIDPTTVSGILGNR